MTNKYKVSVIIPNFNGRELLEKNIPYVIKAKENPKNNIVEIIVIDDASSDDSINFLKKTFLGIKIIRHKKNRGFSCSVNTGVRMAKGDLVVLLNTDVIPDEDFLINTLVHFDDERVFGVSLHERGYSWAKGEFVEGFVKHESGRASKKTHITFWVSGGSGVFRRYMWIKLGGLDEKLLSPFYWEDIDLSYRAHKRGYKVLWESESYVSHKHESTMSKLSKRYVQRIRERNELLFIWKNITSKSLFKKHLMGLTKRVITHPGYIRIVIMALFKLSMVIKRRTEELRESKNSDEAVFSLFTSR